jgi:pimeloyl-ACP methyl ester carboxylesterase
MRLTGVTCPVLLLHGTADAQAAADPNLAALGKGLLLNKKNVEEKKLPGVNHLFQPPLTDWPLLNGQPQPVFSAQAAELIRSWIAARVKK